jgi:hypothetical protein
MNESIFQQLLDAISAHECGTVSMRRICASMVDDLDLQDAFQVEAYDNPENMAIIQAVADDNSFTIPGYVPQFTSTHPASTPDDANPLVPPTE